MICQSCKRDLPEVKSRLCMTAYADQSLNVDPILCDTCYKEYMDHWEAMWEDYYNSHG